MERVSRRLWFRLAIELLAVNAVLLALLATGLHLIVKRSVEDALVDQVRTYGRLLADQLELGDALTSPERTLALLDSVILSGRGVYAEVIDGNTHLRSSLMPASFKASSSDDFHVGDGGDHVYYLSLPVTHGDRQVLLRLGFDESASTQRITRARQAILAAVLLFLAASVGMAFWLAARFARPISALQSAARRIAAGDASSRLEVSAPIQEFQELSEHLESMRRELVGTNERLAREVAEHAAADARQRKLEDRLRQQERVASIGTLAGGIAHEFNNIMTPILLYTQSAQDEVPEDSPAAEDLQHVVACARRARQLVNRILTFSRGIGAGVRVPLDLAPLVDEVIELIRVLAPANVEIVRLLPAEPSPPVMGDADLVRQLIMNLCTNACQAMREAGGTLTIGLSVRSGDRAGGEPIRRSVVLQISDTGHGMSPETLKRIFEPFFTTRDVGEGSGLGLSIVHGIASSLGAHITVSSDPGAGSTFWVYFPVPCADDGRDAPPSNASETLTT